jgi:alpha-glucuronidase
MKKTPPFTKLLMALCIFWVMKANAQVPNGYHLWMGYDRLEEGALLNEYQETAASIYLVPQSEIQVTAQGELKNGLGQMLNRPQVFNDVVNATTSMIIAKKEDLDPKLWGTMTADYDRIGAEGFIIKDMRLNGKSVLLLTANEDIGILYGVFRLLRLMQTHQSLAGLQLVDAPKIQLRMLNHWDNLDRTIERGYAGFSLWNWQKLPEFIDRRYIDYARANASVGINATVLTNVNANALVLTPDYLEKVAALARVFRPFGIKVYLTARFSAPMEIGGLPTADPLDDKVGQWWQAKAKEIYDLIPDFGGFLVKANSEGQPGPQNYGRNHVDGANMLAKAVAPYQGKVIWRAFVYSELDPTDRAKQAYDEFVPYDGQFLDNVLVQVKNGPIDFQPREPFHPLFGAMPKTPLMVEFQITQEYLGFSAHLVYLPILFKEVLDADTYRKGKGSTVAKVVDGTLHNHKMSGIAGVANIGNDLNWTGHPFAQANWYGFGRLAWDPGLPAETIADEWLRATYSGHPDFIKSMKEMLVISREAPVNYMDPLGLHHLFDTGHHYGPGPWVGDLSRPEWNPMYYHKADEKGIGFDRTPSGSNATAQYAGELSSKFKDVNSCPEEYLLWFHHLPWDHKLKNGNILWEGLALKYQEGVDQVREMISKWDGARAHVTDSQFQEVQMLLKIQLREAKWWRDASLLYFQTFSKRELPAGIEKPEENLEYYRSLKFPYAPGIRPRWD